MPLPDRPAIAVLPFVNMSGDPEQEYFSDGISEDIITALSKLRWFFVIARNSSFIYKRNAVHMKQIAEELGGKAAQRRAASPSQMGRFETQWLAAPKNFAALAGLSGQWIDLVRGRRPPRGIVLDMDSSVSPTRRAGDERLERPLRLHLLSPAVRVQSVWRPRTLCSACRQRAQR